MRAQGTFFPLKKALEDVWHSNKKYPTLNTEMFLLINCFRQLNSTITLRERIQRLFHVDDEAVKVPLARSTYSDALQNRSEGIGKWKTTCTGDWVCFLERADV